MVKRWIVPVWVGVVVLLGAGAPAIAQEAGPTYGTVTVDKLNIRAKADRAAPLLGQLVKGDRIPVKKVKEGWARLAWSGKAYVFAEGVSLPPGTINRKPKYEDMREAFLAYAQAQDPTIQWLDAPRATGLTVRYGWREYRNKAALIKRATELARLYSTMTIGEKGITVDIVNGNDTWAKAFY